VCSSERGGGGSLSLSFSVSLSLSLHCRAVKAGLDEGSQPCNAPHGADRAAGGSGVSKRAPEMTAEPGGVCAVGEEWSGVEGEDRNKRGRWLARLQQLVGIVCARRHCFLPLFKNQA
jgi:hypothetical protein